MLASKRACGEDVNGCACLQEAAEDEQEPEQLGGFQARVLGSGSSHNRLDALTHRGLSSNRTKILGTVRVLLSGLE